MDFQKSTSMIDMSSKPRNNFTMSALRKIVEHKGKNGTMAFIKMPSTLGAMPSTGPKSQANLRIITYEDHKQSMSKIEPIKEEQDTKKKIKGFVIDDGSDSGSSSGSGGDISDGEEEHQKDMDNLVDDELTNLLVLFDTLPRPNPEDITARKVEFGKPTRQKTLVLDMDETLIHAKSLEAAGENWEEDYRITLKDDDGSDMVFCVKNRPSLVECLERLGQFYELVVFTAAERSYAEAIIANFDPDRKYIQQILCREQCFNSKGFLVKDLRIISDRRIEDMIIVDNSIVCFAFNLDNGVPISPYMGDNPMDEELIFMCSYLEDVYHHEDIRVGNMQNFKLSEIQQKARSAKA